MAWNRTEEGPRRAKADGGGRRQQRRASCSSGTPTTRTPSRYYDVSGWSIHQRGRAETRRSPMPTCPRVGGRGGGRPRGAGGRRRRALRRLGRGPRPVPRCPSTAEDPGVEYGLDEWPAPTARPWPTPSSKRDPAPLGRSGAVVATDAEASVDELLDGIEQGTLVVAGVDRSVRPTAPSTRCSRRPTAGPRSDDRAGREDLGDLVAAPGAGGRRPTAVGRHVGRHHRRRPAPPTSPTTKRRPRATSSAQPRSCARWSRHTP